MSKIIIINSHPIQYFAPLYQKMAKDESIDLQVWYCSDETLRGTTDQQFGVEVQWDIPLLEGYDHAFFKNHSWKPSIKTGFWGVINASIIGALRRAPSSVVIVPGWQYFSYVLSIFAASFFGHTVCIRTETPLSHELRKSGWISSLRKLLMRYLIFPRVSKYLYIGIQNRLFYEHYGIPEEDLVFSPYSIDNQRFRPVFEQYGDKKTTLRETLGLPVNKKIILYSGKYISKKNPLDVIKAFGKIQSGDKALVMVGEGKLRLQMEALIKQLNLPDVYLTGFVNQSKIPLYYCCADVFVMASGLGETWGLSINEAMNFALPVVAYELTGCSSDLVLDGENGFIIPNGQVDYLADRLSFILNNESFRKTAGKKSLAIIEQYSFQCIIDKLKEELI